MEHSIVNQYSAMIAEEVKRYKNEMLDYFQARPIDPNTTDDHHLPSLAHQYYTTSLTQTTYELKGYIHNKLNATQPDNTGNEDKQSKASLSVRTRSDDDDTRSRNESYEQDQVPIQTFLTEDSTPTSETIGIPFYEAFRIPSNLVDCVMFK
jgi:hypothetical protein